MVLKRGIFVPLFWIWFLTKVNYICIMQDQRLTDIKEKMSAWGIKQQWLANKLGVHRAHLNQWLKGTISMPEDKIKEAKKVMDRIPEPK